MDHCVQYRETDFNFVSRLMEQEGIYYFFEHVDEGGSDQAQAQARGCDERARGIPGLRDDQVPRSATAEGAPKKGSILSWSPDQAGSARRLQGERFRFQTSQDQPPRRRDTGSVSMPTPPLKSTISRRISPTKNRGITVILRQAAHQELQAQHDIILGRADCPGLVCGSKVHPRRTSAGGRKR